MTGVARLLHCELVNAVRRMRFRVIRQKHSSLSLPAVGIFALFGAYAAAQTIPGSEIIPLNRLIRWEAGKTVGVPGGIPTGRAQCLTAQCVALSNATGGVRTGAENATPLIQAAITSAPAHTIVSIPAGRWRIDVMLSIPATKDFITLRGAGADTVLDCRAATCINVGIGSDYTWEWPPTGNAVTAYAPDPATEGTVLTVADSAAFAVGQMVNFQVANDPSLPVISVAGYERMRRQMTRVVAKTASTLTVYPPIYGYERFRSLAAKVSAARQQADSVGIEHLVIDGGNGTVRYGVWFQQTYGSWLNDVTVIRSSNFHVYFSDSLNCEMRRSRLDELNHSGSNGGGLLMTSVSGCLIEDNIIRDAFPNIEVNDASSGNVIAYNFFHNKNGLIGIDINHKPHNSFNLYEGNVAHNLMSDGYYGSNSDDTIYRNLLHGNGIAAGDTLTYCLSLKRFTRNVSVVGNILGTAKHAGGRCDSYGQPNIGNGAFERHGPAEQGRLLG